jgi:hypothetical protein
MGHHTQQFFSEHETAAKILQAADRVSQFGMRAALYGASRIGGYDEQQAIHNVQRFEAGVGEIGQSITRRYNLSADEMMGFAVMAGGGACTLPFVSSAFRLTGIGLKASHKAITPLYQTGKRAAAYVAENAFTGPPIGSWRAQLGYIGEMPSIGVQSAVNSSEKQVFGSAKKSIQYKVELLQAQGLQEHHIIPQSLGDHELFELSGLDIQSRANKIFLPGEKNKLFYGESGRSPHWGRHDGKVFARFTKKMTNIVKEGKLEGWSQEQFLQAQGKIIFDERILLRTGQRRLNKNHRPGAYMFGGIAAGLGAVASFNDAEASTSPVLLFSISHQKRLVGGDVLYLPEQSAARVEVIKDEQSSLPSYFP